MYAKSDEYTYHEVFIVVTAMVPPEKFIKTYTKHYFFSGIFYMFN